MSGVLRSLPSLLDLLQDNPVDAQWSSYWSAWLVLESGQFFKARSENDCTTTFETSCSLLYVSKKVGIRAGWTDKTQMGLLLLSWILHCPLCPGQFGVLVHQGKYVFIAGIYFELLAKNVHECEDRVLQPLNINLISFDGRLVSLTLCKNGNQLPFHMHYQSYGDNKVRLQANCKFVPGLCDQLGKVVNHALYSGTWWCRLDLLYRAFCFGLPGQNA